MPMLVGVYVDVGMGARSLVPIEAAAGGCKYNIISVSRLGSISV
jgi:hypothetical protein